MTTYKIVFFHGSWLRRPSRGELTDAVPRAFRGCHVGSDVPPCMVALRIRSPFDHEEDGTYCVAHIDVDCGDCGEDVVSDFLFEALLRRLVPEYDSLLEIEQVEPLSV